MKISSSKILIISIIILLMLIYLLNSISNHQVLSKERLIPSNYSNKINRITVVNNKKSDNTYTIDNDLLNGELTLEDSLELEGFALNFPAIQFIWDKLINIEVQEIIYEDNAEQYFQEPLMSITYNTGKEEITFIFGKKVEIINGYYVKEVLSNDDKSNKETFIVNSEEVEQIINAKNGFYLRNLIDFNYESDYEYLNSIEIWHKDNIIFGINKENDDFLLSYPISYICNYHKLKSILLDPVMHLKWGEVADELINFSEAGLDDPNYTIKYSYKGDLIDILIGKSEGSETYISKRGSEQIFLIENNNLSFLGIDYRELIGDTVYNRRLNSIKTLNIKYKGKTYNFDALSNEGKNYNNLLRAISNTKIFDTVDVNTYLDDSNNLEINISLYSEINDHLVFTPINDREYAFFINDISYFSVQSRDVDNIIDALDGL